MKQVYLLFVILFIAGTGTTRGQTTEDSVRATITLLFDGMKQADSARIYSVFAENAILQTIVRSKEGVVTVRTDDIRAFTRQIGKIKPGAADEQIRFETIRTDGDLAIAWTPYRFYYQDKFSHCGVNSFQLVRISGVWKIQYLVDTRRKQGCD